MTTSNTTVFLQNENLHVLGKLAWLWMNSPLHHSWQVSYLNRFVLPPVVLNQYMLIERNGFPVAYCSWALFSKQAELMYMLDSSNIQSNNWTSGDRLWFIDWVAPFSKQDSIDMKNLLIDKFPSSLARAIRVKKDSKQARVMKFRGRDLSSEDERILQLRFNRDFASGIKELKEISDKAKQS